MTDPADTKTIVVKVGTSSITQEGSAALKHESIAKLCGDIAEIRDLGHRVVLVSSAAIAAGMAKLGLHDRPRDFASLQALSAVGQIELMRVYDESCRALGFDCGQVLLAPPDFFDRARYLRARSCIEREISFGVLPIVNENDAVADDAIRFGDNDRIAALVAHLVHADPESTSTLRSSKRFAAWTASLKQWLAAPPRRCPRAAWPRNCQRQR